MNRDPDNPWHAGEVSIQARIGVAARMNDVGRKVIRDYLPDQHREFYPLLPFVVLGTVDDNGDAWATLRGGSPGFLTSPNIKHLLVSIPRNYHDPAEGGMEDGDSIGLLGIDLRTRRRNRLNGTIRRVNSACFGILVEQSFGNCPKYIRLRDVSFVRNPEPCMSGTARQLHRADADVRAIVTRADTFFVASYAVRENGLRQVDVSHRAGRAGFVRYDEDGAFTIPDFAGNLFFNTLGNFLVNPRAGLAFPDFETGDLLQLTGEAVVIFQSSEISAFKGAERLWRFVPRRVIHHRGALRLHSASGEDGISPDTLETGNWESALSKPRERDHGQTRADRCCHARRKYRQCSCPPAGT